MMFHIPAKSGGGKTTLCLVLLYLFACLFVLSFVLYAVFNSDTKKLLLFESLDKKGIYAEICVVPKQEPRSSLEYFCSELLLGPKTDRYRPLFADGTRALSVFKGIDGVLYINLNKEALLQNGTASQTLRACELLEKNMKKNAYAAGNVIIAVSGQKVYEYSD